MSNDMREILERATNITLEDWSREEYSVEF